MLLNNKLMQIIFLLFKLNYLQFHVCVNTYWLKYCSGYSGFVLGHLMTIMRPILIACAVILHIT